MNYFRVSMSHAVFEKHYSKKICALSEIPVYLIILYFILKLLTYKNETLVT